MSQQNNKRLGIALVGLGQYAGEELAPALKATNHCELAAIVSDEPEKMEEWRKQHGLNEKCCYTYDQFDAKHAATIDTIEVGKRIAGPVRLALRVNEDIDTSTETFVNGGAKSLAKPTIAPWSYVARIEDPQGMQITLFTDSTIS